MVWMSNPLWVMGKVVVMDSGFCVMEVIVLMVEKGVFGLVFIKKLCYCTKEVPEEDIIRHMQLN